MLVNYNLNNLSGGISQQQPELRFDNQVEDMVNFTITDSNGLVRRNPTTSVLENVTNAFTIDTPIHSYTGSDGISYGMYMYYDSSVNKTKIMVFDTSGVEKTVSDVSGIVSGYFGNTTPYRKSTQFLTVGDTTWILNKDKTISKWTSIGEKYSKNKAFYWVKRSFDNGQGGGYSYEVVLNGTKFTASGINTISVATTLATNISNKGYVVKQVGSILRIRKYDSSVFTFESGDSWGNQASFGWTNEVPKITDLPADMRGFDTSEVGIIPVTGSTKNEFTNYYVKWTGDAWKESGYEGIQNNIDYRTMPIIVKRQSDGSFATSYMTLDAAKVGDEKSNPFPSFVGKRISNIFFFKDRLGFTSDENVCLSETGEYGNFFATTVMEILDSDPIDVTIDSNTVSNIRNVTASGGALTLWSDNAQFLLAGGEVLSPATTRISQTSSYSCYNNVAPIVVDNEVLFINKKGTYSELMAYSPASLQADKSSAESLMAHLPRFIKSDIVSLNASPEHNMVFILTASEPTTIYVYKYLVQGSQKVMSSFFKWTFDSWTKIKGMICLNGNLYIIGRGELGAEGDNPSTLRYFVRKIALEHSNSIAEGTIHRDVANLGTLLTTSDYKSMVSLSRQNLKTNQGSYFISEKFRIKNIKISLNTPNVYSLGRNDRKIMNVMVKDNARNSVLINSDATGIEDGLYLGIDSEHATIELSNSVSKQYSGDYLNIGTISISGMINHRSKNI